MEETRNKHAGQPQPIISYKLALRLCWERGLLEYLLKPHQKDLFKILEKKTRRTVINCSRRFGKTTTLLIYASKFAIQNPGSLIRFVSPTQKSLKKSVHPIFAKMLKDCPVELRPVWHSQEGCYKFPNGSEIHLYGVDNGHYDALRGSDSQLFFIDEAAFTSELKLILDDILTPQTLTNNGRGFIASTPNKKATASSEYFQELCSVAEMKGYYHEKTIFDNTSLSKATIEEYMEIAGGLSSTTFRVEYLCKFEVDSNKSIVPEWDDGFIQDLPEPEHYDMLHKYVSLDLGFKRDFTAALFGYYDFFNARLVILDEFQMRNMTTTELVTAIKAKEKTYFTNGQVYRRVSDSDNLMLLHDMGTLHQLPFMPTNKSTLETMVNKLRVWVQSEKIIIHPRCKGIIGCLAKGVWADNMQGQQRKDFGRTDAYGHFDYLASLIYLVRNIDDTSNPIPTDYAFDTFNMANVPGNSKYSGPHADFKNLFTKRKR